MLHPEYVRGFIDGEGCFYYNDNAKYTPSSFRVYNKDLEILKQFMLFFKCGHIYTNNHGSNKDVHEFVLQSKAELKSLLVFLEKHPPIVKRINRPHKKKVTTIEDWIHKTKQYVR